ncbi:hypothetical protein D030_0068B, partial [Vibrio parahaemolyticus AQ3810]
FDVIWGI